MCCTSHTIKWDEELFISDHRTRAKNISLRIKDAILKMASFVYYNIHKSPNDKNDSCHSCRMRARAGINSKEVHSSLYTNINPN